MNPTVTIVICTYNRPGVLDRCLRSVASLEHGPFETIVVDNAPELDGAKGVAALHGAEYRVAPLRGLSRARNVGSQAASSEFIAYLDDDMVVHPKWLSSLLSAFSSGDIVATTGPILPMRLVDVSPAELYAEVGRHPWGIQKFKLNRGSEQWFERAIFGGIGDGNFALRRDLFEWWHGFEERIGRGRPINIGEEHYAFFEFIERGHAVAYSPDAVVFHPEYQSDPTQDLAQDIAFAGFLAVEWPRFFPSVLKFFISGFFGRPRRWRTWSGRHLRGELTTGSALRGIVLAVASLWQAYRAK